jgi:hypothetical protein
VSAELARQRYLQRHIEPDLPTCPAPGASWHNVLVIPAYREPPELLQQLALMPAGSGRTLAILILNRPDSDPDRQANSALRQASSQLAARHLPQPSPLIRLLNDQTDLYIHDLDYLSGPIPAKAGVGLARKIGCDIAFKWISQGAIESTWICCTDADAQLPSDYFSRLETADPEAVAAVYPFRHTPGAEEACNIATGLYELRLHHYLLGLEYAGSPYAFHTLGSCLAVKASAYPQVRGFPQRAGGEDFYLLNKLAKLGPVARLKGQCISLQSRHSSRAPFGTGPAVEKISDALQAAASGVKAPAELPLFYHPACFEALRCILAVAPSLYQPPGANPLHLTPEVLARMISEELAAAGLDERLSLACTETMIAMGLAGAVAHCRRQGKSPEQFLRQFHQWFDAFRTLKLIHGIRDIGWPLQTLEKLHLLEPQLWPSTGPGLDIETLRRTTARHWEWTV